jgi:hypothetical protein
MSTVSVDCRNSPDSPGVPSTQTQKNDSYSLPTYLQDFVSESASRSISKTFPRTRARSFQGTEDHEMIKGFATCSLGAVHGAMLGRLLDC